MYVLEQSISESSQSARDLSLSSLREPTSTDLQKARDLYCLNYSLAGYISWPGYRRRHRLLRDLCGAFPLEARLPPWWRELIALAPEPARPILATVSAWEFYEGQMREDLFRELKARVAHEESPVPWARSPRLGKILLGFLPGGQAHEYYRKYQERGSKMQHRPTLFISAHPWDVLSFGSSHHYSSCQDLLGEAEDSYLNKQLPANLLDSGMVVSYVPGSGLDRWTVRRMQTRVILRLLRKPFTGSWGILIDRFYGDRAHVTAIRQMLTERIVGLGLQIWSPENYYEYTKGEYREVTGNGDFFSAEGVLQDFSSYETPYLDQHRVNGSLFRWAHVQRTHRVCWRLSASMVDVTPAR